jgi:hypothetical protein
MMSLLPWVWLDSKVSIDAGRYGTSSVSSDARHVRCWVSYVERSKLASVRIEGLVVEFNELI